ncbi:hypothetical protein CDAR_401671 [Caerostris darwini]|uniref:Uncharacterized protein n=1 Tax=Caerostris darwini TaxID=1538125 RepID=A0AAV4RR42_9ARAC|nr:hypothetical protein CDAR_401671 [Caerostris darwini]
MVFVPSLQHMSCSKIAVTLCNQADMKAPFNEFKTFITDLSYPKTLPVIISGVVERAKQKTSVLKIPEKLMPDLIFVLKSTVLIIFKWFIDHLHVREPDFDDVSSIQWRSEGTIDIIKTAQALVQREDASLTMRRVIVPSYCLETDIFHIAKYRAKLCREMLITTYWMRDWCKYSAIHNCRSFESLAVASGLRHPSISNEGQLRHRMGEKDLEVVFAPRHSCKVSWIGRSSNCFYPW